MDLLLKKIAALKAALEKAQADLQKQIDKMASLETVDKKIADLKKELEGGFVTDENYKLWLQRLMP